MKNLMKLLGIIVLTATIGFGMTACGNGDDDDPPKVIAADYRGTITGASLDLTTISDNHNINLTVGETSLSWTGDKTGSQTGVYTESGGTLSDGKWAYLYKDGTKIGMIAKNSGTLEIITGNAAKDNTASIQTYYGGISLDFTGISDYPSIQYYD